MGRAGAPSPFLEGERGGEEREERECLLLDGVPRSHASHPFPLFRSPILGSAGQPGPSSVTPNSDLAEEVEARRMLSEAYPGAAAAAAAGASVLPPFAVSVCGFWEKKEREHTPKIRVRRVSKDPDKPAAEFRACVARRARTGQSVRRARLSGPTRFRARAQKKKKKKSSRTLRRPHACALTCWLVPTRWPAGREVVDPMLRRGAAYARPPSLLFLLSLPAKLVWQSERARE